MAMAAKTLFMGLNPEACSLHIRSNNKSIEFYTRAPNSHKTNLSRFRRNVTLRSSKLRNFSVVHAISSGLDKQDTSTSDFNDFSVSSNNSDDGEIKIRVDVSSVKTQTTFDNVFSKLVAAAQPIPGFRRIKGGKTPDIPKDVLLHLIGPPKVNKQTIKEIINSTIAEYVKMEALKVTKDLKVEQSFEELEAIFTPGEEFAFDAIIHLQETKRN